MTLGLSAAAVEMQRAIRDSRVNDRDLMDNFMVSVYVDRMS